MHVLLVEDDLDLGFALQGSLRAEGMSSDWRRSAGQAPMTAAEMEFDCVLLDLTLPDGDGLQLLRAWRQTGIALPVIVMTARSALEDRLEGLDGGADDFVIKPFAIPELVSRIRAVVRRYARQASDEWQFGDVRIRPRQCEVRVGGEPVGLTPREFMLLMTLAQEAGTVVSKSSLAQRLSPLGESMDFSALEVHVSNLRRKIGVARIRTVRGIGYMLQTT